MFKRLFPLWNDYNKLQKMHKDLAVKYSDLEERYLDSRAYINRLEGGLDDYRDIIKDLDREISNLKSDKDRLFKVNNDILTKKRYDKKTQRYRGKDGRFAKG
jgi:chromosome segregation ATPase